MNAIVNLILAALLILGSGYGIRKLLHSIEKATIKKIKSGLSSSEQFAQQLTGKKLKF